MTSDDNKMPDEIWIYESDDINCPDADQYIANIYNETGEDHHYTRTDLTIPRWQYDNMEKAWLDRANEVKRLQGILEEHGIKH